MTTSSNDWQCPPVELHLHVRQWLTGDARGRTAREAAKDEAPYGGLPSEASDHNAESMQGPGKMAMPTIDADGALGNAGTVQLTLRPFRGRKRLRAASLETAEGRGVTYGLARKTNEGSPTDSPGAGSSGLCHRARSNCGRADTGRHAMSGPAARHVKGPSSMLTALVCRSSWRYGRLGACTARPCHPDRINVGGGMPTVPRAALAGRRGRFVVGGVHFWSRSLLQEGFQYGPWVRKTCSIESESSEPRPFCSLHSTTACSCREADGCVLPDLTVRRLAPPSSRRGIAPRGAPADSWKPRDARSTPAGLTPVLHGKAGSMLPGQRKDQLLACKGYAPGVEGDTRDEYAFCSDGVAAAVVGDEVRRRGGVALWLEVLQRTCLSSWLKLPLGTRYFSSI
jgi:hypothetical protein